ncbi:MAG: DUF4209 domain-containing protein [Snowella sp.]|nr:DUF4209 domain-containing protein [Snowella sp.]
MSPPDPLLNKDDFLNSSWQDVVINSGDRGWLDYWQAFRKKAQVAETQGNVREKNVFELLARITFSVIPPDGKSEEHPLEVFETLSQAELNFLFEIVHEISDSRFSELTARIADILWIKKFPTNKCQEMAKLAIDSYLESAKFPNVQCWLRRFEPIQRAFCLAYQINDPAKKDKIFKYIEDVLDHHKEEDSLWLPAKLMELLVEKKLGDSSKYSALSEILANLAELNSDWEIAREYWELKAQWHRIEGNKSKEFESKMFAAETYVKQAEAIQRREAPSYSIASKLMESAYVAFRKIPDEKAKLRANQCHKILLKYQEQSSKELIAINFIYDSDQELQNRAREMVKNKDFPEALFSLVINIPLQKVSDLTLEAEEYLNNNPLTSSFPVTKKNLQGKTTAKQRQIDFNNPNNNPKEIQELIKFQKNQFSDKCCFYTTELIQPARQQINLEHNIHIKDLLFLVQDNSFVPSGREYLFAKGLYAGLMGDFFTSTHLLIPQIENSVRYLLWQKGIITSGLDDRGIQNEHNLNSTLYRSEIGQVFDEDVLFHLKCLLVEHSGCNLRNRMAHGLMDDQEFQSGIVEYLWWFTLRLCCLPMLNYQDKPEKFNSFLQLAGMFNDDPFFEEFEEAMANNRQQLEIEIANSEDEEISAA